MNTKRKLNCYIFSNLIISFLSLNLLTNNQTNNLVLINNIGTGNLKEIYQIKTDSFKVNDNTNVIHVSNKVVQSKNTKIINYVKPSYNQITGTNLVNYAKNYLGLRYVSGGYSLTNGTDCSGFTKLIYNEFNINLGRNVNSQIYSGQYVSKNDLEPGDLVFYGYNSNHASHVAIYMGNSLVIHQSNPNDGVKISPLNMMVYITARRVIFEDVIKEAPIQNSQEKEEIIDNDNLTDNEFNKTDTEINKEDKNTNLDKIEESNSDSSLEIKDEIINDIVEEEIIDNKDISNLEEPIIKEDNSSLNTVL